MKCTTVIDPDRDEEILIYLHRENGISQKIKNVLSEEEKELIGYSERCTVRLEASDVFCFIVECGKMYALTKNDKFRVKSRLYVLEELFSECFIKINQSCLINKTHVSHFEASLGGSLTVILKNGFRDYISRRQLKTVKERMGF